MTNGNYAGYAVLARSAERMETVRVRAGRIYISSYAGIFVLLPVQADPYAFNDYDDDGKSDFAVYRDGYWSVMTWANGIITENSKAIGGARLVAVK